MADHGDQDLKTYYINRYTQRPYTHILCVDAIMNLARRYQLVFARAVGVCRVDFRTKPSQAKLHVTESKMKPYEIDEDAYYLLKEVQENQEGFNAVIRHNSRKAISAVVPKFQHGTMSQMADNRTIERNPYTERLLEEFDLYATENADKLFKLAETTFRLGKQNGYALGVLGKHVKCMVSDVYAQAIFKGNQLQQLMMIGAFHKALCVYLAKQGFRDFAEVNTAVILAVRKVFKTMIIPKPPTRPTPPKAQPAPRVVKGVQPKDTLGDKILQPTTLATIGAISVLIGAGAFFLNRIITASKQSVS